MEEYKDTIADKVVSGELIEVLRTNAYSYQKEIESGERPIVGLNCFTVSEAEDRQADIHRADQGAVGQHLQNLKDLKRTRNQSQTAKSIEKIIRATEDPEANIFPSLLEAAHARATVGEMMGAIRMGCGTSYDPFGMIEYPF
jgi:methylmalonyl-CoA mutase N-terminal domain/subunit